MRIMRVETCTYVGPEYINRVGREYRAVQGSPPRLNVSRPFRVIPQVAAAKPSGEIILAHSVVRRRTPMV